MEWYHNLLHRIGHLIGHEIPGEAPSWLHSVLHVVLIWAPLALLLCSSTELSAISGDVSDAVTLKCRRPIPQRSSDRSFDISTDTPRGIRLVSWHLGSPRCQSFTRRSNCPS